MEQKKISRRQFLKSTGAVVGGAAVGTGLMGLSGCATTAGGSTGTAAAHRGNSPIFQPTKIGSLTLKNKMFRAAMAENRNDANFSPAPTLLRLYEEDAAGGTAMIITGGISVLKDDYSGTVFAGFSEASQIPAYKAVADIVHRNGSKICAQIMMIASAAQSPFGVARISREDIRRSIDGFAQTAVLVRDAGYDAIEFHFAHGYLGAQFWAHYRNTRTDEYGGSAENRARYGFEVLEAVRRALGRDFPLTAKINATDHRVREGSSQEETNYYVQGLADRGIDAVEISGMGTGIPITTDISSKEDQNYFSRDARNISKSVNVPLILTGGIRNVDMMEEALKFNDKIIGFGMARTILAEPDLPLKWQNDTNHEPKCISCNWCINNIVANGKTQCTLDMSRA